MSTKVTRANGIPDGKVSPPTPAIYHPEQVYAAMRQAGFKGQLAITATQIAYAESRFNANDLADTRGALHLPHGVSGEFSVGLMQLNVNVHLLTEFSSVGVTRWEDLYDPLKNAAAAFLLYKRRGNFTDWSSYNSLAYKATPPSVMQQINAAVIRGGQVTVPSNPQSPNSGRVVAIPGGGNPLNEVTVALLAAGFTVGGTAALTGLTAREVAALVASNGIKVGGRVAKAADVDGAAAAAKAGGTKGLVKFLGGILGFSAVYSAGEWFKWVQDHYLSFAYIVVGIVLVAIALLKLGTNVATTVSPVAALAKGVAK